MKQSCITCGYVYTNLEDWYGHRCGDGKLSLPQMEKALFQAAVSWDMAYSQRSETIPVDDELHFAVQRLMSAKAQLSAETE